MELLFHVGFHEVSFHFFLRIIDYKQSLLFSKVSCANKKEKMKPYSRDILRTLKQQFPPPQKKNLSSKCLHDNLNFTLHVTTTAAVHLLRDNITGQENMNRYKFIKEEILKNVKTFSGFDINGCKESDKIFGPLPLGMLQTFRRLCDYRIKLQNLMKAAAEVGPIMLTSKAYLDS